MAINAKTVHRINLMKAVKAKRMYIPPSKKDDEELHYSYWCLNYGRYNYHTGKFKLRSFKHYRVREDAVKEKNAILKEHNDEADFACYIVGRL